MDSLVSSKPEFSTYVTARLASPRDLHGSPERWTICLYLWTEPHHGYGIHQFVLMDDGEPVEDVEARRF